MAADAHAKDDQLSDEESIELVRRMGEAGVPLLFLTGGEPFMRKNFWEILAEAKAHDIRVTISTNATFIDRETAKRLKKYGVDYIATSLYGPAEFHDAMVGVPGTRDRVVKAVRILREEGVGVALKTAVSTDTWPYIYDLIQEAKDLDAGLIYLCDLITSGRSEGEDDGRISVEQWQELADFIAADVMDDSVKLEYDIGAMPSFIPYVAERFMEQGKDVSKGLERLKVMSACPVGKGHMNINSEGGIMPCQFAQDWTIGNIREMTFEEATSELFKLADAEMTGICSDSECEYALICRGCRTKAFHQFGDPLGEDTTCMLHTGANPEPSCAAVSISESPAAPCCGPGACG
jgi:MoaA/NifB/PqqE/SkfB family radical SAM enzyme